MLPLLSSYHHYHHYLCSANNTLVVYMCTGIIVIVGKYVSRPFVG